MACRFFAFGNCKKGNNCPYSHKRCRFYEKGSCKKGDDCDYVHMRTGGGGKEGNKQKHTTHLHVHKQGGGNTEGGRCQKCKANANKFCQHCRNWVCVAHNVGSKENGPCCQKCRRTHCSDCEDQLSGCCDCTAKFCRSCDYIRDCANCGDAVCPQCGFDMGGHDDTYCRDCRPRCAVCGVSNKRLCKCRVCRNNSNFQRAWLCNDHRYC
mmetsp:Transcript_20621/g.32196  ORF Transcript_20621/g.32196 Transcript_20621/m.32196 type:complete len:209 (-) Transcript_20621:38-664(-)